jgi:hypothetical protein
MLNVVMQRRTFIAGAATATAGFLCSAPLSRSQVANQVLHCLVRESGDCGVWPLVIGVLLTDALDTHNSAVDAIRQQTGFNRELKYSSTDEYRIPFAMRLIDYFVAREDLLFHALIVEDNNGGWPDVAAQRDPRYFAKYRDLLEEVITEQAGVVILTQERGTQRDELLQQELKEMRGRPRVERQSVPPSNMAQLAGFLAGCVRGDQMGATKTKEVLLEHLKGAIDAPQLQNLTSNKLLIRSTNI